MAQPDRAKAEGLDRALVVAALDIFADPEGVIEQVEYPGDHVANAHEAASKKVAKNLQNGIRTLVRCQ